MALIYIGTVVSVLDTDDGERIKVRIEPSDKYTSDENLPDAFPLLPKMLHIKPKEGEAVCVICSDEQTKSQRWYIGPIISQPQNMFKESAISATALLQGGYKEASEAPSNIPSTMGAFGKSEDIVIYGRKNSDIILSDDDVRIRCGVRLVNEDNNEVQFNKEAPAYIKLKYHQPRPLNDTIESTATIVADKINLISPKGSPHITTSDADEGISDEDMKKIIETAHQLPYGDILVDFLTLFLKMFKSHTHKYHNDAPCPDVQSLLFDLKYGSEEKIRQKLLSNDIRIN